MSIEVFFFGGSRASEPDMQAWAATAKVQRPNMDFNAFHWIETDKEKKAVAAIKASKADVIFIVGHSSGCANANAVDNSVYKSVKDTKQVVLVALDGFAPVGDQGKRSSTQIWSAANPDDTFKNFHKAKNYDDMKSVAGPLLRVYPVGRTDCTSRWGLHFSLVNTRAKDTTDPDPIPTGYARCHANLCWLTFWQYGIIVTYGDTRRNPP
jgi:hypothetical protein